MRLIERRVAARAAFVEVRQSTLAWRAHTQVARAWCSRHRAGVIVGGGFAAGLLTTLLPIAPIMRLASALASTAALMLEGPFLRLLTAAHRDANGGENANTSAPTP